MKYSFIPKSKVNQYVCPEDYESEKAHLNDMNMDDIIELTAVDMNYGYVPMKKDNPSNVEMAAKCNLKRFGLESKGESPDH